MNRALRVRWLVGILVGGALSAQGCSSDSSRAPAVSSGGRVAARGGAANGTGGRATGGTNPGADSGAGPGGESGDAGHPGGGSAGAATGGSAGGAEDAGGEGGVPADPYACPSDTSPESAPALASQCDPSMMWGKGEPVPVNADSGDQLIGVTPDELTIVWFDSGGSVGTYRLADRSASDAAFDAAVELDSRDLIALSPDGLRLVGLSFDQSVLIEYVRAARGQAFGAGADGAFSRINADALAKGYRVLDALVAPDDTTLYYNTYGFESLEYSFHVSSRSDSEPWPAGNLVDACELKAFGSLLRHPTGASADGLTLFFYDPTREVTRAAFRQTKADPFTWFVDLGQRYQATPNQSCDKLYFGTSDIEASLFVASAQ